MLFFIASYQLVAGIVTGALLGLPAYLFKLCKANVYIKAIYCLIVLVFGAVVSELIVFHESRYIGIITFGYVCHLIWKHDVPEKPLEYLWIMAKPVLFGMVGAAVRINDLKISYLGFGVLTFVGGLIIRWLATFAVGWTKRDYTVKEKLFNAFAWIPKATVQAAIGGILLDRVRIEVSDEESLEEYQGYGYFVLTTAILSIIISAPIGGILTVTLGPKWLEKDNGVELKIDRNITKVAILP